MASSKGISKLSEQVARQTRLDKAGVRVPSASDSNFFPMSGRSTSTGTEGAASAKSVAKRRGPKGSGTSVKAKPNPRKAPKRLPKVSR